MESSYEPTHFSTIHHGKHMKMQLQIMLMLLKVWQFAISLMTTNLGVFAGRFGSILGEFDVQNDQKYMDWFGLNLHIFVIKPKPNQSINNRLVWVGLNKYIRNKCAKTFSKNI